VGGVLSVVFNVFPFNQLTHPLSQTGDRSASKDARRGIDMFEKTLLRFQDKAAPSAQDECHSPSSPLRALTSPAQSTPRL
jgi:hypothetical protein